MNLRSAQILLAGIIAAGSAILVCGAALSTSAGTYVSASESLPAKITVDYPINGSVFPPEITPPTFLWHDPSEGARRWVVEISFADHSAPIRIDAPGALLQMGAIDPKAGAGIELTPEQATTRTWKPDAETWEKIKHHSVKSPVTITIKGFMDGDAKAISAGKVTISTSADAVGAPIFYRDVPLKTANGEDRGPIAPLPPSAIPLIKWRVRSIAEPESRVVMENLPTCANCHSFSRDGKTFGLDLDGPRNDKGLYALVPVSKDMTIRNQDVIHWSSFELNSEASKTKTAVKRFGFMSQISPDGRYVVTSIGAPDNENGNQDKIPGFAPGLLDRLYSTNYKDFGFLQVFYPTRGILAFYDKKEGRMKPLPGADDPHFVQTSAFWSPDGKFLIFSRATARDPFPAGVPKSQYANDPNETQIQYDLYKIPFNGGMGGKAVPVEGASANGMSNNFPKVSPDGRWIVFVQNRNGLLMRPDSKLYIVPFEGGKARLMNCNTPLMNSWHTFSPNGRWLAFSSKARSPYTQLMLTHIDAKGHDSPSIIVDNTTAANRAVNIPEFVNVADGGLERIDPEATNFYRMVDQAFALAQSERIPEAIETLRGALKLDPDEAMAHYNLATLLTGAGLDREALPEYRTASTLEPDNTLFLEHLGAALAVGGAWKDAIDELERAVNLAPASAEFQFNLGYVVESSGDYASAVIPLQKAVELSHGKNSRFLSELAKTYSLTGHFAEAVRSAQQALDVAEQAHDEQSARNLREALENYERDGAKAEPR